MVPAINLTCLCTPMQCNNQFLWISQLSLHPIQLPRRFYLTPSILSSDWKIHGMSPSAIRSSILQPLNILQHLSAEIIFYFHRIESGCEVHNLVLREFSNLAGGVKVETGHETRTCRRTNTKEGLQSSLRARSLRYENLVCWPDCLP